MKNKVLTTRIMAMMMVAAMTMSAAPAVLQQSVQTLSRCFRGRGCF